MKDKALRLHGLRIEDGLYRVAHLPDQLQIFPRACLNFGLVKFFAVHEHRHGLYFCRGHRDSEPASLIESLLALIERKKFRTELGSLAGILYATRSRQTRIEHGDKNREEKKKQQRAATTTRRWQPLQAHEGSMEKLSRFIEENSTPKSGDIGKPSRRFPYFIQVAAKQ